ncbi:unnamed protein product [Symbiodinium pilosum]|uniref:Uncharacterized protein n=1 Tax=Symbiodinium pilosum TaxID=2952 RepID=A0A812SEZ7_SYMPI|nr:unnamed protein product [Symbiodinium pilosum]
MRALTALGGKGTHKQVRDYLRNNPELFEGTTSSNRERCIEVIRLSNYCEPCGKNEDGELTWGVPSGTIPRGVRRKKKGFAGFMQTPEATLSGPVRSCPKAAGEDYNLLSHWRKTLESKALMERVSAWEGAKVLKGYKGTKADRKSST